MRQFCRIGMTEPPFHISIRFQNQIDALPIGCQLLLLFFLQCRVGIEQPIV